MWLPMGGVAAAAIVVGVVIGCSRSLVTGDDPSSTPIPTAAPTGSAQPSESVTPMAWTEPAAYVFTFVSSCGERSLIGEFDVVVEDGIAISYLPVGEPAALFPGGIDDIPTLGQLWARAQEAGQDAEAVLALETDAIDGHPTAIDIDWLPSAIDDEECYRITHYAAYPAASPSPNPSGVPAWTEPDAYVYVFNSMCGLRMLNGRYEVTVVDGEAVDYRSLNDPAYPLPPSLQMPTLADLLNQVERARADRDAVINEYEVDPQDGHPTYIDIDWMPNAIDDEECYIIESYTPGS